MHGYNLTSLTTLYIRSRHDFCFFIKVCISHQRRSPGQITITSRVLKNYNEKVKPRGYSPFFRDLCLGQKYTTVQRYSPSLISPSLERLNRCGTGHLRISSNRSPSPQVQHTHTHTSVFLLYLCNFIKKYSLPFHDILYVKFQTVMTYHFSFAFFTVTGLSLCHYE